MNKPESTHNEEKPFIVYKQRFLVLFAAVVLSISNSTIWMSFAPVSTIAAEYFEVEVSAINWFTLVFYLFVIPLVFGSTYILSRFGLGWSLHIGSALSCFGAIVRAVATSGLIEDRNKQFAVVLVGQMSAAMAQSFIIFTPAKLSQVWFPETQRTLATTVLTMGYTSGIVVAQATIPFIVDSAEDIPRNLYVWAVFAIIAQVLTIIAVRRNQPKTPPSRSANMSSKRKLPYFEQVKSVLSNRAYVILMLVMGAGTGAFTSITAVTQQMLCPLGYSKEFAGLTVSGMILVGFIGALVISKLLDRTKKYLEIIKLAYGGAAFFLILMLEFYLVPSMGAVIAITGAMFGFFGLGAYSVGFELGVEITYPVEESISTGFILLASQVNGAALVVMIPSLASSQKSKYYLLNKCSGDTSSGAKDYSIPVMVVIAYVTTAVCVMIIFLKTKYKRQEADKQRVPVQTKEQSELPL